MYTSASLRLVVDDYIGEGRIPVLCNHEIGSVNPVVLQLLENASTKCIIGHLGYNPWSEAQASSSGERVAGVSASLDLEREAADLVVGAGEGGDGGEVVHGDGAAAQQDGVGHVGGGADMIKPHATNTTVAENTEDCTRTISYNTTFDFARLSITSDQIRNQSHSQQSATLSILQLESAT